MENLAADFIIDFNNPIEAEFEVSEGAQFDAEFSLNVIPDIAGDGVIDVTLTDGVYVVTSTTYIHEQGISSDTWTIEHNLNKFPSITLVDTAGTQFQGRVEYIDENNCIVYMNGATKGKAYLN